MDGDPTAATATTTNTTTTTTTTGKKPEGLKLRGSFELDLDGSYILLDARIKNRSAPLKQEQESGSEDVMELSESQLRRDCRNERLIMAQ